MEKVKELGIERNKRLLFISKEGDVWQLNPKKKVAEAGITREKGYLYFVDKQGDISRVAMKRRKG